MISDRERRLAAKREFKKPVTKFEQVDLSDHYYLPIGITRAYRNTRYTVMVFDNTPTTKGFATKALIQKHDNLPITGHWSELQKIKNEIFGEETTAIEYYPANSRLVDEANIYWLWIFPDGIIPVQV